MARACSVPGCDRPHKQRGFCNTHAEYEAAHGRLPPLPAIHVRERFMAKVSPEPNTGCWLWLGSEDSQGYGDFNVAPKDQIRSHRAAWILFKGPIPEGMQVCHHCDNRACVNYETHLFLAPNEGNVADMVAKDRHARGIRNGHAKLTDEAVMEIRAAYASGGISQRALGACYGVDGETIGRVVRREGWKHVEGAE